TRIFLVMQNKFTRPLQQRRYKCFLTLRGQCGHRVTMKVRSSGLRRLVRRNVRRDKINPPQLTPFTSGSGKRQVALVYGIESAAEKADVHIVIGGASLVV